MWAPHLFFVSSSTDRHSGGLYPWALVNNATLNTGVHKTSKSWFSVPLDETPRSGVKASHGSCVFQFLRKHHTV